MGENFRMSADFRRAGGFPHPTRLVPAAELIMAAGFVGAAPSGIHSGAFSGFNHGGVTSAFSSRGKRWHRRKLFTGGGGFHGGGGHR